MSGAEAIRYYFDWQAGHGEEWHVMEDILVEIPTPADQFATEGSTS